MGLDIAQPKKIKTACGKGYWECTGKETPEITLTYPGIHYFRFSSASSVFYWDIKQQKLLRVWVSD